MTPFRLDFYAKGALPDAEIQQHIASSTQAGIPLIQNAPTHDTPLAVVGGGASALERLEELKAWPGHIWAINQGAQWLASKGRTKDVWLFSTAPTVRISTYTEGVERAIVSSSCHPSFFEAMKGKDVRMFNLMCGPATACNAVVPSAMLGYRELTYFGCDGNIHDTTHIYRNDEKPDQLVIRASGKDYVTTADLYYTTQFLAGAIKEYPDKLKEKSGGLLRAMLDDGGWHVVAVSESLRNKVMPGAHERYNQAVSV